MSNLLVDICTEIEGVVSPLIRDTFLMPQDQVNVSPVAVVYPKRGVLHHETPETLNGLHTIYIDVLDNREGLPRAYTAVTDLVLSVPNALAYALKTSAVFSTIVTYDEITYEIQPHSLGGADLVVCRFVLSGVYTRHTVTAPA